MVVSRLGFVPVQFVEILKSDNNAYIVIARVIEGGGKKSQTNEPFDSRYLADVLGHLPAVGQLGSVIGTDVLTPLCIEGLFVLQLRMEEKM